MLSTSVLPARLRPTSLAHRSDDVAVRELRKPHIVVAQGTELSWLTKANHTIRFPCQFSDRLLR